MQNVVSCLLSMRRGALPATGGDPSRMGLPRVLFLRVRRRVLLFDTVLDFLAREGYVLASQKRQYVAAELTALQFAL